MLRQLVYAPSLRIHDPESTSSRAISEHINPHTPNSMLLYKIMKWSITLTTVILFQVNVIIFRLLKPQKKSFSYVSYKVNLTEGTADQFYRQIVAQGGFQIFDALKKYYNIQTTGCNDILKNRFVLDEIRKSDVIITVSIFFCGALVAEHLNKPFIVIHPTALFGLRSILYDSIAFKLCAFTESTVI